MPASMNTVTAGAGKFTIELFRPGGEGAGIEQILDADGPVGRAFCRHIRFPLVFGFGSAVPLGHDRNERDQRNLVATAATNPALRR